MKRFELECLFIAAGRRHTPLLLLPVCLLLGLWAARSGDRACGAERVEKPNVILILADDLAVGDLASRNGGRTRTPNLDRLAARGIRFEQAYSASCVCAPARAAMLTGRYPHRTGVVTLNMEQYPDLTNLRPEEITVADVMRRHGYTTGLVGKWHVGRKEASHPLRRGFDEFEGFRGGVGQSFFRYTLEVNGRSMKVSDGYLTDDFSRRAVGFVRRHRDEPFFLHLAHFAPHRPLEAPEELVKAYTDRGFGRSTATIYAMIEIMDRGIGELLAELDRLQITEKTIVLFTSDNGPDPLTGTRFNARLRGTKYQVYEGGIRVPLMVCWPGTLKPGTCDSVVHFVDLFPTILDLCGVVYQAKNPLDGTSFRDLLEGRQRDTGTVRYWQWNRGIPNYTHNAAMRQGPWKLVRPFVTRQPNPKDSSAGAVLYNLSNDPAEAVNLARQHPEQYESMRHSLEAWCRSVEADRTRSEQQPVP